MKLKFQALEIKETRQKEIKGGMNKGDLVTKVAEGAGLSKATG